MAEGAAVGEATVTGATSGDGSNTDCTVGKVVVGDSGTGDKVTVAGNARLAGPQALKPSNPTQRMPNIFSILNIGNRSHFPLTHQNSILYLVASV